MTLDAWWFLLIPVLFGLGWFAARIDRQSDKDRAALPGAYFKGLNFLLNEQPDKAIDAFVDVVRIEPETVELHFALGSLFRRRGETERAIRVHQNLVARTDLTPGQRENALFELGQDYLKSGLLDRAEDAFNRLEGSQYRAAALKHRLQIAQMVRDWPEAIKLAEQLNQDPAEKPRPEIAHFHCELADTLAAGRKDEEAKPAVHPDLTAAREALGNAARVGGKHPRPALRRGQLELADGHPADAIESFRQAFDIDPRFAALVADQWLQAHQQLGSTTQGIQALEAIQKISPSVDVLHTVYGAVKTESGDAAAHEFLESALREAPSLLGYRLLLEARISVAGPDDDLEEIELAQQLIKRQADRLSRYVCGNCGFSARKYYWQCPGCSQWDTYAPRRAEEQERQ
ncbi:MAG: lipopolysaccharide assembly protein LapB [Burkholderiaceae bacterium]